MLDLDILVVHVYMYVNYLICIVTHTLPSVIQSILTSYSLKRRSNLAFLSSGLLILSFSSGPWLKPPVGFTNYFLLLNKKLSVQIKCNYINQKNYNQNNCYFKIGDMWM